MKALDSNWYKSIWGLDIKEQSWVQDTENQVDFIVKTLELTGNERILDLACGFGRHALSLARRGFQITGVDITKEFIQDAIQNAESEGLKAQFINSDIRDLHFANEYDVVLNLADGAIGYLESDEENLKIFDVISNALKPGGKHFMDICNAQHAEQYFPVQYWDAGESTLSVSRFEWDDKKRIMLYGDATIVYGEAAKKPDIAYGAPQRLYSIDEINEIWKQRGMQVMQTFSDYYGKEASYKNLQLMVSSRKL
ncbi:Methyltransferase domain-containing protein [[Clostridium] fimetarium]|uniref:Methyltransferase domain-containing protein n=2 Tax=[Clostridium] fimetarium TaxID=99656 RepID=A0A1I0PH44_9FIRM|nr:Methyltransferase domain-containing protein [[Clostridium] fimetarium]